MGSLRAPFFLFMASTTIDTDTELSAVNSILGAIGQSPITVLKDPVTGVVTYANPEISFIYNLLRDANVDVQSEGWHFNTEKHVEYTPDSSTDKIEIGSDVIKLDVADGWSKREYDVVARVHSSDNKKYLYDKFDHTDLWTDIESIHLDVTKLYAFENVPQVFQRYIIYRAARMAATQLVANPQLVQLLQAQENLARATMLEYECNQGNHSMLGLPEDSVYTTYQPWRGLRR